MYDIEKFQKLLREGLAHEVERVRCSYGPDTAKVLSYALSDSAGSYGGSLSRGVVALLLGTDSARTLHFAIGVELLHHATLCVDDVVDSGVWRRGKKSAWQQYSPATAVLLGHLLSVRSLELFAQSLPIDSNRRASQLVSEMVVAEMRTQSAFPESLRDYLDLVRGKTGSLYAIASLATTIDSVAGPDEGLLNALRDIGGARQIRDDVADANCSTAALFTDSGAHKRDMERSFGLNCCLLANRSDIQGLQMNLTDSALAIVSRFPLEDRRGEDLLALLRRVALGE